MERATKEPDVVLETDTFVALLRRNWTRFERIFKVPPPFPRVRERRDQATLSPVEQERFLCALDIRIADGSFGRLVNVHADMTHHMHAMGAPGDPPGAIGQQRVPAVASGVPTHLRTATGGRSSRCNGPILGLDQGR